MDLDLKGRAAIITAASRGLGKAAARALAREGANLAISSRTDQIFAAAEEIQQETGVDVLAVQTDLTEPKQIEAMIVKAHNHFQKIDILIINAGGPPPGGFLDLKPEDWSAAVDLTVMSAVRLCYAVVPHMLEQGHGSIVATQSYSVKQPIDNLILSNSLRMAVIGLVKSLANELGPKGIRVNSINPAWTWTERVQQLMMDRAERSGTTVDEQAGKVTEDAPLGRMGTVEEYGKAIAWLASPAASFIHGHALMFDGGATKAAL
ncbi:MAG: SDR family oxidoreductase [Anaerolineales bacterium]